MGLKVSGGSKTEDQAPVAAGPPSPISPQNGTKPHSPTVPEDIFLTPVCLDDENMNDAVHKNGENKLDESMIDIFGDMDDSTDFKSPEKAEDKTVDIEKVGEEETNNVNMESTRKEEEEEFNRREGERNPLFEEIEVESLGPVADSGVDGDDGGMGGGIMELDLTVDLPDPTVLGTNIFGVETIPEEEEEVAGGVEGVTEMSDDFEDDDSMEDAGLDESRLQEVVDEDGGLGGDRVEVVSKDMELKDEVIKDNVQAEKEEEVKLRFLIEEEKNTSDIAVVSKMRDDIIKESKPSADVEYHGNSSIDGITSEVDIDKCDDDVDGSNYPGTSGTLPTLEAQKTVEPVSVKDGDEKTDTSKEVQEADVPVVFIDTSLPEQQEKSLADDTPASPGSKKEEGQVEEEEEEREQQMMRLPEPKEVIIIMKDAGTKKEPEKEEEKEKEEVKEEEESAPEPQPVETDAPQESSTKEDDEKENVEIEKEDEEIMTREPTKEEIVEERRLSVAASKALFEARIPEPDPVKTNNRVKVNGFPHRANNIRPVGEEQTPAAETKAEADTKVTEKEKAEEEKEEKIAPVIEMDKEEEEEKNEEEEKLVSLKDRISRYQSLASKTKGITSHVPTRTSPSKQRPASTSNIENKDRKFGPKVPSKPSSTSFSKPSSTATTTDTSKPSTNPSSSSSSTSTPSSSTTTPPVSSTTPSVPSPSRKPLTPKIDRCLVCQKAVYQNEMSKLEGHVFHRRCQKCSECQRTLTLWNVDITGDKLYCKQHGSVVKNKQLQERLVAV
ncbi:uncharacterized protein [Diadema antillarum]|uniref:uncharacterized protein isoform X1 n=1 Tax=Diadema antillarum TaxID=105358 RepID=UPI003A89C81F